MKYCINCLQPNTRPNSLFSENGVCPACQYFNSIQTVDWKERHEIILEVIYSKKKKSNILHDCIMGVSGGKDSTRQAVYLRDNLKLNPMLVCCSYPPDQVSETGVENSSNLIELGFDVLISAPAPGTWKKLKIAGFEKFTNSFRSTEMALFSSVVQAAVYHKINLIFWGENPGLQLGDQSVLGKTGYDGNNFMKGNTLSSGTEWMEKYVDHPTELFPYIAPNDEVIKYNDIQVIYLGWLMGDWSLLTNGLYAAVNGFDPRDDIPENTGDLFGVSAIDEEHTPVNQLIKYYKFGFGKTTEYVNEEIRLQRITRESGVHLVEKFDGIVNDDRIKSYCDYLQISVDAFWEKIYTIVNKELFYIDNEGKIIRKFSVGNGLK